MTSEPAFSTAEGRAVFLFAEQPSLDWAADGDEFIDRLGNHVARIKGTTLTGGSMRAVPFEYSGGTSWYRRYGYSFSDSGLATELAVIPLQDGTWKLGVEANGTEQVAAETEIWVGGMRAAEADLGRTSEHPWWAVVAPTSSGSEALVLDHTVTVAGVTLMRPVAPYARIADKAGPRGLLWGGQIEVLYPVVARGTAVGYQGHAAMARANDQILLLCAALTLESDAFWEVIEVPGPFERAPDSLPLAEDAALTESAKGNYVTLNGAPSALATETVAKMQADTAIADLVAGYYHARAIEEASPSLAAVIYVSVIETVGGRFVPLTRCDCCAKCDKKEGAGKRFRHALKLVLPSDEAKRLAQFYNKRSTTAHQATLHGAEFRLPGMRNSFTDDPADYFLYQEVRHVRAAAGELLRLLVRDELPASDVSGEKADSAS